MKHALINSLLKDGTAVEETKRLGCMSLELRMKGAEVTAEGDGPGACLISVRLSVPNIHTLLHLLRRQRGYGLVPSARTSIHIPVATTDVNGIWC